MQVRFLPGEPPAGRVAQMDTLRTATMSNETESVIEQNTSPVAIVLAAGEGTRMKSNRAKVLHTIGGHTLLHHVCEAVEAICPSQTIVVVGFQSDVVGSHASEVSPACRVAVQATLSGPVTAVQTGLDALTDVDKSAEVVVVFADMPMLSGATLQAMVQAHRRDGDAATVLAISGQDDADPGAYVFDFSSLTDALAQLPDQPSETTFNELLNVTPGHVGAFYTEDMWQGSGVDDRVQLAKLGAEYNRRQVNRWMRAGVTVIDPSSTWIEADVDLAPDVTLLPGTMLTGATSVAQGATIGPETTVKDSEVGEGATITRSQVELSVIGAGVSVGPYARLRPGTQIGELGVVGTFVETKNVVMGARSRIGHLTYCGDATLGDAVDMGAGVIFANWDATNRARTEVGASAIIGAGALLIPPTTVAEDSVVQPGVIVHASGEIDTAKRVLKEDDK